MGMVVRTNTMSINAYRQLGMNNSAVSKSLEKLSSGFRINRAGDDASGLAISEKMKAQINGLEQASANAQDGISLIQTAEGATTEIHNMLNRMVTLATKSANGTIQNEVDREAIQTEVDSLKEEITRIAKSTNFNGINLLDGSLGGASKKLESVSIGGVTNPISAATANNVTANTFTAGTGTAVADSTMTYNYTDAEGDAKSITLTLASYNATDTANATSALATAFNASDLGKDFNMDATGAITAKKTGATGLPQITGQTWAVGTDGATITGGNAGTVTAGVDMSSTAVDLSGGAGTVLEINGKSYELVANAGTKPATDGATAVLIGADAAATIANLNAATSKDGFDVTGSALDNLTISSNGQGNGLTLQVGDTNAEFNHVTVSIDDLTAKGLSIDDLDVSDQVSAGNAIDIIKAAINKVSTNRGNLGALQNRLEYTINNLDTTNENMTAANSRIRDTDMAKEMMNYTKMNILTQAAQAMLAQANQQPQSILQLLQ